MDRRTPLVVVSGWSGPATMTGYSLLDSSTAVLRYDLGELEHGVVRRTVRTTADLRTHMLEPAHDCVACTIRDDLLPTLCRLGMRAGLRRLVLILDRSIEPESVCRALDEFVVTGIAGRPDAPASRDIRIEAVLTCLDGRTWWRDATADEPIDDAGTVARLAVGRAGFADALVVVGTPDDPAGHARLAAVLARLAPSAPITWLPRAQRFEAKSLLAAIPSNARRGAPWDPHGPLLRGQPPLDFDGSIGIVEFAAGRPFHPGRLHEAVEVLRTGVLTARGRVWLATRPDHVRWLESAGGTLRVRHAGPWLAAMTAGERETVEPERRAMAALRWHERFGDRHTSLTVLVHAADPAEIERTLRWALVTDTELADPRSWRRWADPFGEWHEDPCETTESPYSEAEQEGQA